MLVFNPGPTKTHQELSEWIDESRRLRVYEQHHRSKWFEELYDKTRRNLLVLGGLSQDYRMFLYGCASEIWERSMESVVQNKLFILAVGEFGKRWLHCAKSMGFEVVEKLGDYTFSEPLTDVIDADCDTICLVHGETAVGLNLPSDQLRETREKFPDKIIIIDAVSTFPIAELDYNCADVIIFSSPKCFCLPSGLGVALVNKKAIERADTVTRNVSGFASFKFAEKFASINQTPATPNILNLWLLWKATELYLKLGLGVIRSNTRSREKFLCDVMAALSFNRLIKSRVHQSETVLTFETTGFDAREVKAYLEKRGFIVSTGFADLASRVIRIANFPSYTMDDYQKLVAEIKTGLEKGFVD